MLHNLRIFLHFPEKILHFPISADRIIPLPLEEGRVVHNKWGNAESFGTVANPSSRVFRRVLNDHKVVGSHPANAFFHGSSSTVLMAQMPSGTRNTIGKHDHEKCHQKTTKAT